MKWFILALLALFFFGGGCGDFNTNLTDAQQEKEAANKLKWVDKAIQVAESHGLSYKVEVSTTGRPSIGESLDFYVDTGLKASITMFGNAAAGRIPNNPVK